MQFVEDTTSSEPTIPSALWVQYSDVSTAAQAAAVVPTDLAADPAAAIREEALRLGAIEVTA
jgi:hypothetical protein